LCAALFLLAVPAAQAALGFQDLSAKPANLAAGANSDFRIHIGFSDPGDQVKDLIVHLPPGQVGNATATPLCTVEELHADRCPTNSQVGTTTAKVDAHTAVVVPLTVNGSIYNLVPRAGEPARFGIVLRPAAGLAPKIVQQSAVTLRPDDFGLDTTINDFPREANGLKTDIKSLDITLFGTANGNGFSRNPTSCMARTVGVEATSYSNHHASASAPAYTPSNCEALPFSPVLRVEVGGAGMTRAGSNTPLTTVVEQADGEAGLENAKVLLPTEIGANPATTLNQCPLSQFRASASECPADSIVGRATATSPFLASAQTGSVVVVEPPAGDFLAKLGVDLHGQFPLQIVGSFIAETNGLGNAFTGLPDIPISRLELRFHGGREALVSTGLDLCNSPAPVFHADFAGYNEKRKSTDPAATVEGCDDGGKPKASVKLRRTRSKHPRMRFKVRAGPAPVAKTKLRLPKPLRFAKGKAWRKGVSARADSGRLPTSAIQHSKRRLNATAPAEGTDVLVVKLRRHALRRARPLANRTLRLRASVRDIDRRKTSRTVKVHVR